MSRALDPAKQLEYALELLTRLSPLQMLAKVDEFRRGGFSADSIPSGSRSAETPLPVTDVKTGRKDASGNPQTVIGVRDAVDRWLKLQQSEYGNALAELIEGARRLGAIEASICQVMDRSKANEILMDEEQGEHRFQCLNCKGIFKRTKNQRPRRGRCLACFDWWRAHGCEEERPRVLWERDMEKTG